MVRSHRLWSALVAVVCAATVFVLGGLVGQRPDPPGWMSWEAALVNHSTLIAWWLTWFGYAAILGPASVAVIVIAWRNPSWRWRAAVIVLGTLLAWQGASLLQHHFMRPRRLDWVVKHETAFSFPSSHAAVAASFYATIALMLWRDRRAGVALALALLACGIVWSRLALGAHYATDLMGGFLWGAAVTAALATIAPINVFESTHGRPVV